MNEVVEHKNAIVLVYIAYATGYINSEGTGTWIFGLIYLDYIHLDFINLDIIYLDSIYVDIIQVDFIHLTIPKENTCNH